MLTPDNVRFVQMDDRSLSQILDQAIEHHARYKKEDNAGSHFVYLFEMYNLLEHLWLISVTSDNNARRRFANTLFDKINGRIDGYTGADLEYISLQVERLEAIK